MINETISRTKIFLFFPLNFKFCYIFLIRGCKWVFNSSRNPLTCHSFFFFNNYDICCNFIYFYKSLINIIVINNIIKNSWFRLRTKTLKLQRVEVWKCKENSKENFRKPKREKETLSSAEYKFEINPVRNLKYFTHLGISKLFSKFDRKKKSCMFKI